MPILYRINKRKRRSVHEKIPYPGERGSLKKRRGGDHNSRRPKLTSPKRENCWHIQQLIALLFLGNLITDVFAGLLVDDTHR